jgi:colanic acid/amylovoran biosynthesis protein
MLIALVALMSYRLWKKPIFLTRNQAKRQLLQTYFSADIVIGCGGQVLATKRRLAISFYWIAFSILFAHWLGKPIYMFPQTIGPLATWHHQVITNFILAQTRLIMLRDRDQSLEIVTAPSHLKKTVILPDAAFGLPGRSPAEGWQVLSRFGIQPAEEIPTIGMTLMNWSGMNVNFRSVQQEQYEKAVVHLIRHIVVRLKGRVFLFGQVIGPSVAEDDRIAAARVMEQTGLHPPQVILVKELTDLDDLMCAYATLNLLVGTRMHSNIMALVSGVPVCAIGYLIKKTSGSLRWVGLEEFVCDINGISGEKLISLFERAWQARNETQVRLAQVMPAVSGKARRAGQLIAEDWESLQNQPRPRQGKVRPTLKMGGNNS